MAGETMTRRRGPTLDEDSAALTYFERVSGACRDGQARAGGPIDRFFLVAGQTVRVQFAGTALLPYVEPALVHLMIEPHIPPDLTIEVWDSASTGTPLPAVPWRIRDQSPRGSVAGYNTRRMRTAFQGEITTLSLMDRDRRRALFWVCEPEAVPPWDRAAPLRAIFHWLVESAGGQVVHAAALGTPTAGALLVGRGGSGKSTTTLMCLDHGLTYVGDDYIALLIEPTPRAWSLYCSAKLNCDSLQRLPGFMGAVSNPDRAEDEKALLFLSQLYGERLVQSLPAKVVIVPRIVPQARAQLVAVSRATGLRALAPSSMLQLPDAERAAWQTMVDFVRRVPCYELQIGADSSDIPTLIAGLLESMSD